MTEQFQTWLIAGIMFLGTVVACLLAAYAFVWLCGLLGVLLHLAMEDLDAMTLAGLIFITLAVCGFVSRHRRRS